MQVFTSSCRPTKCNGYMDSFGDCGTGTEVTYKDFGAVVRAFRKSDILEMV